MKQIKCASIEALSTFDVDVEATFTKGLPSFSIVGLGSSSIQESKDRIKSALLTNDFKFPPLKITINLSPSDIAKNGTHFDTAIALLIALYNEKVDLKGYHVFGELGLDGTLKDTKNIYVLILSLASKGLIQKVVVPRNSIKKVSKIPNIEIYVVDTLFEAIDFFKFDKKEEKRVLNEEFNYKYLEVGKEKFYYDTKYDDDFLDVRGQSIAKKAALIASAGNHNILFEGSAGCGKSMISKRMRYIMPPMNLEEILELAMYDSLESNEPNFRPHRVYRSPHHSGTKSSIFGGGSKNAKMGEVALANNGILFFDELPHFPKNILEALREPLEDHKILISRVNSKISYDTKFLFIGSMNPCPCGNLLSTIKECRCNELEIQRYKSRLSEPFMDRMDLYVVMNEVTLEDKADVSSKELHEKVISAFAKQKARGQKELNGKLSEKDIKKYCVLDKDSQAILDKAIINFKLSFRSINKVLKVARTIADLNDNNNITKVDIMEALSFRKR